MPGIRGSFAFVGMLLIAVPAVGQTQLWMGQFGSNVYEAPAAGAPDGAGGLYVFGQTQGSLAGPNAGSYDAFLTRYDQAGVRLWIRQFGTGVQDEAAAAARDGFGGVYVAGHTYGSLGGTNAGYRDIYLARYAGTGNQVWVRQIGTPEEDFAQSASPDGIGGVYVAGWTYGHLGGESFGGWDAYVARYSSAGSRVWMRQFGTPTHDQATTSAADGVGGVFVAGNTFGDLGGPNTGNRDVFIAHYGSAGQVSWTRQFGTASYEYACASASDGLGGVFVAGHTKGALGGPNAGGVDAYLARFDAAGQPVWVRQFGTPWHDYATALAVDGKGGVYLAGYTPGPLGGPSAGANDAFVAHYTEDGARLWIRQFGSSLNDSAGVAVPDGGGGVFVAGATQGSLAAPIAGLYDPYVARYMDACYADCDLSGTLTVNDYICFQTKVALGDPYADCDGSGVLSVNDYVCFQTRFALGCP